MQSLTLQNGETVALSLNFKALLDLRDKRPEAYRNHYKAVNEIGGRGDGDNIWPRVQVIYTAYLCGKIREGELDSAMEFGDFLEQLPENTATILLLANELISPNDKRGSVSRSRGRRAESAEKA